MRPKQHERELSVHFSKDFADSGGSKISSSLFPAFFIADALQMRLKYQFRIHPKLQPCQGDTTAQR